MPFLSFSQSSFYQLLAAGEPDPSLKGQWLALGGGGLLLFCGLLAFLYKTRGGIIARATTKEAIRQPVFSLLLTLGLVLLVVNTFLPFFSLGEDVKMLKDCGLATMLISGLLLAVWTASTSIADEIEGKTAMTLLSKPINRRQFVVGKYIGILVAVALLLLPMVAVFLGLIDYKVWYDARESSRDQEITHAIAFAQTLQVLPGVALSFMEIAILAALSVAISTRLPMVVNIVSCLAIFVVGHLTTSLVQTSAKGLELLLFMANIISTVLPTLENFNIGAEISTGAVVPPVYLASAALYAAAYSAIGILLAFILFEDRDLA